MSGPGKKYLLILLGLAVLVGVFLAVELRKPPTADAAATPAGAPAEPAAAPALPAGPVLNDAAIREKVIAYVRERFGMPSTVTVTADAFKPSAHADFEESVVHTDNGKNKSDNSVLVTKDQKWLVVGKLVPVKSDPKAELIASLREQFKIPATTNISASDFRPSAYPRLLASTVSIVNPNKPPETQDFYLTSDRQALVVGGIFNLTENLRKTALKTIDTVNQARLGPANAPVTIVEYADLQCPSCARMHDLLENDIMKKYPGHVRVIFKEFPLASIHEWTLMGSIANQCVYQINPSLYSPFRSLLYKNQMGINAGNARELMLTYGEQLGIDRLRLAGCIDSKASLPRVEANFLEGKKIGVQSTPTLFINGQMMVGLPQAEEIHKRVDEALRTGK